MQNEDDTLAPRRGAKSITPVVMLLVAASVFSYLACFAIPQALVTTDLMPPWPPDADPRPGWMLITFCCLTGGVAILGVGVRLLGWRQCRHMESPADM